MSDAAWIANLAAHGLSRSSCVPRGVIREPRDQTRNRKQLISETAQYELRIHETFEDANLKLGSVLSDVLGKIGRFIAQYCHILALKVAYPVIMDLDITNTAAYL